MRCSSCSSSRCRHAQFFQSIGLPGTLGYAVFAAENSSRLLLIAGVGTALGIGRGWCRCCSAPPGRTFGNGWLFSAPNGGWDTRLPHRRERGAALLGNGAYALANLRAERPAQLQAA